MTAFISPISASEGTFRGVGKEKYTMPVSFFFRNIKGFKRKMASSVKKMTQIELWY
ncbi:MAG: hypothetical protein LBI60_05085 [Bacteroidales bacterium]|jgi:hypothetical protein|nr:hypothetical protein [Bacteroidales bacterium]